MRRVISSSVIFFTCILLHYSCKKEQNYTPNCSGSSKSYAADVKPLIQANCQNCHSQYGSYTGLKNDIASVRSSIANGSMPKGKNLSDAEKDKILCWIDAGAANN